MHVELLIRVAHPDSGPFVTAKEFVLRALHEPAWGYDDSFAYRAEGPLGDAVDSDQVLDEDWCRAHVDQYIARVDIIETRNLPLAEDAFERTDTRPSAHYAVQVTEARWLAHLETGQSWHSAAYCD